MNVTMMNMKNAEIKDLKQKNKELTEAMAVMWIEHVREIDRLSRQQSSRVQFDLESG